MTLPELFAAALGVPAKHGPYRCYFCGAACDDTHKAADWVKPTWTRHQYVASPASPAVCVGCTLAMCETASVHVVGESAPRTGQKTRNYSWLVTPKQALAYTKGQTAELLAVCLDPPEPPYGIAISTTGQRHVIYCGLVNTRQGILAVSLDEEVIRTTPDALRERVEIAKKLCAASGKPALSAPVGFSVHRQCAEHFGHDGLSLAAEWSRIQFEPLSRLAAFLCPKKEIACEQYPKCA